MRSHIPMLRFKRNPYRLRQAARQIARITAAHPGVIAFPVLKTGEPATRAADGDVVLLGGNLRLAKASSTA